MLQYQTLIREIMTDGTVTSNRTGIDAIKLDGAMMRFRHSDGFPAVTSKKLAWKQITGETCGFFRGARSAATFRALGCKVWDGNANGLGQANDAGEIIAPNPWLSNPFRNGEDDLGPIYGAQWREWPGFKLLSAEELNKDGMEQWLIKNNWQSIGVMADQREGATCDKYVYYKVIDQLGECIRKIIRTPHDRRILFHGWNPAVLDEIALPACHLLYQFLPNTVTQELNMILYVRSNDVGLGTPFNIAEGALIQAVIARLTGYKPGRFTYFIGDAHIYENQLNYLNELLTKDPLPLPTLVINSRVPSYDPADNAAFMDATGETQIEHLIEWLGIVEPDDFILENYQHHTLVTPVPKMAV